VADVVPEFERVCTITISLTEDPMRFALFTLSSLLAASSLSLALAQAPAASPLRVGAAKVDVTPEPSNQPVLDRLHSRAIVIAKTS
jgi:hypothetical protein